MCLKESFFKRNNIYRRQKNGVKLRNLKLLLKSLKNELFKLDILEPKNIHIVILKHFLED
ncbi:hypothetical protein CoNPh26_CDS0058 [Staphylococcus phage S-CoN_Ph26]|nr:hypothetical protein CoNPh26_CDS0058 [Staphylococcus phage S-CoN_Ph26]